MMMPIGKDKAKSQLKGPGAEHHAEKEVGRLQREENRQVAPRRPALLCGNLVRASENRALWRGPAARYAIAGACRLVKRDAAHGRARLFLDSGFAFAAATPGRKRK